MLDFVAVDKALINDYANSYYHKDAEYFLIRKGEETAGIFGIKKISKTAGEMTLLIFENFKHGVLTKTTCKQLLNFPKLLGFGTVFLATQYQSMIKLCHRFGMQYLYDHNGESWYKKEL
ncbi:MULTISPECIES: hypothetical protein [Cysteiniphilum]|uniref:hypothetical protein n=1 Tax=Cysteiniphilum TaxID=2056696 RepID=UPI00177CE18B|nr:MULTISPECIES: hypothetical protein [Cysteiniphilum]